MAVTASPVALRLPGLRSERRPGKAKPPPGSWLSSQIQQPVISVGAFA
ncbi:hypothetical protein ACVGX7_23510 [Enterobacter hormaechei]